MMALAAAAAALRGAPAMAGFTDGADAFTAGLRLAVVASVGGTTARVVDGRAGAALRTTDAAATFLTAARAGGGGAAATGSATASGGWAAGSSVGLGVARRGTGQFG